MGRERSLEALLIAFTLISAGCIDWTGLEAAATCAQAGTCDGGTDGGSGGGSGGGTAGGSGGGTAGGSGGGTAGGSGGGTAGGSGGGTAGGSGGGAAGGSGGGAAGGSGGTGGGTAGGSGGGSGGGTGGGIPQDGGLEVQTWLPLGGGYTYDGGTSPIHLADCGSGIICFVGTGATSTYGILAVAGGSTMAPRPGLAMDAITSDQGIAFVSMSDGGTLYAGQFPASSPTMTTTPLGAQDLTVRAATVFQTSSGRRLAFVGTNSTGYRWLTLMLTGTYVTEGVEGTQDRALYNALPSPTDSGFLFSRPGGAGSRGQLFHAEAALAGISPYERSNGPFAADGKRILGSHSPPWMWMAVESNAGTELNLIVASTHAEVAYQSVANSNGRLISLVTDTPYAYVVGDFSTSSLAVGVGGAAITVSPAGTYVARYSGADAGITLEWVRLLPGARKRVTEAVRIASDAGTLLAVSAVCEALGSGPDCGNGIGEGVIGIVRVAP